MTTHTTRRTFTASAFGGFALLAGAHSLSAMQSETTQVISGGIGWPRDVFEDKFGAGTEQNGMMTYQNPFVDGSKLTTLFEDDIAIFIDMSDPDGRITNSNVNGLLRALLPEDAISAGLWRINSVDGTPLWEFEEFIADSMNMAGSGSTHMMISKANVDDSIMRATISLATPDAGSGFAPTEGSLGVGSTIEEWSAVWGDGHDGHGAMGTYDGIWDIEPWETVFVMSQRDSEGGAEIIQIDAISSNGVDVDTSTEFAEQILPQQSQLEAGYSSYAVANRNQGWGMSTWNLSDHERMILCMIGAGDDSGNVLQVATAIYRTDV